jgi:hypothetical protein
MLMLPPCALVDVSHGGGTSNVYLQRAGLPGPGMREDDWTLLIGQLVAARCNVRDTRIALTRDRDIHLSLSERARIAWALKAGLVIAPHVDVVPGAPHKCRLFVRPGDALAEAVAGVIQSLVPEPLRMPGRHIQIVRPGDQYYPRVWQLFSFYPPAPQIAVVVMECGDSLDQADVSALLDPAGQVDIADAICGGIGYWRTAIGRGLGDDHAEDPTRNNASGGESISRDRR